MKCRHLLSLYSHPSPYPLTSLRLQKKTNIQHFDMHLYFYITWQHQTETLPELPLIIWQFTGNSNWMVIPNELDPIFTNLDIFTMTISIPDLYGLRNNMRQLMSPGAGN